MSDQPPVRFQPPRQTGSAATAADDTTLEAALQAVLQVIFRDHPLTANQILTLAAEVQKLGVHRLVEEHLHRAGRSGS